MAKLVVLSPGMTGRSQELKLDKTTIGRVEDNTFQIAEPSVSSHHCEVVLRGSEVVVRDLNSTNGTFINGERVTESVLKPGQILRLGQIEMRFETDAPAAPSKKPLDHTLVMQRGVSLNELEQGTHSGGFGTKGAGFSKKDDKGNKIFWGVVGLVGVIIVVVLLYALTIAGK
ncbi:MAG TPA: FHA domain-containing protein [Candidatus Paceibacterota bacterium]|nr:FHA domain-containing protein [Verrucomicrobiota bacterium]HSA10507.1 FHA domain-containing protein [Candidatus Paceibacterota bacterium]